MVGQVEQLTEGFAMLVSKQVGTTWTATSRRDVTVHFWQISSSFKGSLQEWP